MMQLLCPFPYIVTNHKFHTPYPTPPNHRPPPQDHDPENDDARLLLDLARALEAATALDQFASLFQMRLAPDLVALYLQLQQRFSPTTPAAAAVAEEASRRLGALEARLGPRVMVAALQGLLGRGAATPGKEMGSGSSARVYVCTQHRHTHSLKSTHTRSHYTYLYTAWLRSNCSQRMTAVLMAPGGLRAVMEAFLGGLPQQEEALQVRMRVCMYRFGRWLWQSRPGPIHLPHIHKQPPEIHQTGAHPRGRPPRDPPAGHLRP